MNRKTIKDRTGAYHVTLPIRLVEEFDELLSYKASRSKAIAYLMRKHMDDDVVDIGSMEKRAIVIALMNRIDSNSAEYVMLGVIKDIFTSSGDPSSS